MGGPHRAAARSEGDPMSRRHPRRARFGVEALESRELTALMDAFLKIEGVVAREAPTAEVQVVGGSSTSSTSLRPAEFIIL
jgi:hypothetical protein